MYQWPIGEVESRRDPGRSQARSVDASSFLSSSGLDQSLVDFLEPFYERADGATFADGTFRAHPLGGLPEHGIPDLIGWNKAIGWKQHQPEKSNDTFYFSSNAFGDLYGVPVDSDGAILRDRVGILWVERYQYQEAVLEWRSFFSRLFAEPPMRDFFLRLPEYAWAAATLGRPAAWECFSSNVPAVLGGANTIENVGVQSLVVHVSFTLQVIRQARERVETGSPVGVVELYDENGRLIE